MATLKLDNVPTQLFIGGEWVNASTDSLIDVTNPATGEVMARVATRAPRTGGARPRRRTRRRRRSRR